MTITRKSDYGNMGASILPIQSFVGREKKKDDVIRMANEMISKERPVTNEVITYEVNITYENGETQCIHSVEAEGKRSI